jgi:hypothetical protein
MSDYELEKFNKKMDWLWDITTYLTIIIIIFAFYHNCYILKICRYINF